MKDPRLLGILQLYFEIPVLEGGDASRQPALDLSRGLFGFHLNDRTSHQHDGIGQSRGVDPFDRAQAWMMDAKDANAAEEGIDLSQQGVVKDEINRGRYVARRSPAEDVRADGPDCE